MATTISRGGSLELVNAILSRGGWLYGRTRQRLLAAREMDRVGRADQELGPRVAAALSAVVRGRFAADERGIIDRIESLRDRLERSETTIAVVDYGIGTPDREVDARTAFEGRVVERTVGELCRTRSMAQPWPLVLFALAREFRPGHCVELGACMGISTAYQAAALSLNDHGSLVAIEGSDALAEIARKNLAELGLSRADIAVGRFQDRLDDVLRRQTPVDLAFIDGHHERQATLTYFEQTLAAAADRAILVFDDVNWSKGMKDAWREIYRHPRVRLAVDLGKVGFVVLGASSGEAAPYRVSIA